MDESDEVGGLHQSTVGTNELEDQPFSPQHETSCDYKTDGHSSLLGKFRESKNHIDSNNEDNSDSDRGTSTI